MKKFILILIILLYSKNIYSNSLFDSDFYEISFSSNNIENDKLIKISDIKFITFFNILEKTLLEEDYNILKKEIDEDQLNSFIQNIIIEDEKIINDNYFSKVKINFKKKKIINFFRINKIDYLEYLPSEMLVIILENSEINMNLFSKNNLYYNYLIKNNKKHNFYKLPNLDINDRFLLSDIDIKNLDIKKINIFKKKYYDLDTIILISNNKTYKIYLLSNDQILEINTKNYINYNYEKIFTNMKIDIINKWKIINKIQNKKINKINCEIKYYNLNELKQIKLYLNEISIIKKYELTDISYKKNKYDIYYYGNNEILRYLFSINKININNISDNCKIFLK